jgi:hypothetical protein
MSALLLGAALAGHAKPAPGQDRGHRDPFAEPLRRNRARAEAARPRGLAGIGVDDLTLRGLVLIGGNYMAVLQSGTGRSHLLRGGETLFDGSVRSVTAEGVLIVRHARRGGGGSPGRSVLLTLNADPAEER